MKESVRKNATHKESSREKSHIQKQSLMAGSNSQAGLGKMAQHRLWARHGFYRRGRLRKLMRAWESPVRAELVLEHENFCLRVGLPFWLLIHKTVTLLLYHSPIFSLIMMGVGAEDWELG
jgi:hypothetical protein